MDFLRGEPRATLSEPDDVRRALGIPFSDEQLDAIVAPLEPGVIIAGAGSGKTTVMAARVVWLVGTGAVRPEQVLGLTFTRKAAAELSSRVRAALTTAGVVSERGADVAGEHVVMTYDAFAARVVSEHGLRLGYDGDTTMLTGASRYRLVSRVVAQAAGPFEYLSRLRPATVTERVLKLDGDIQAHLVADHELDSQARRFHEALDRAPRKRGGGEYVSIPRARAITGERLELASLVDGYRELKARLGMVEFADQMAVAARLVRQVPAVSDALRDQFRVVLLDEYQDTSSAQAQLLRGLFAGEEVESGLGHPVTAVGDPFQAIYGWRGAAASNILAFAQEFARADGSPARSFSLTTNRRSGQLILDVANQVAAPLRADPNLASAKENVLVAPREKQGVGLVRVGQFVSWPEECAWIAADLLAAHRKGVAWRDHAVLARRNADIGAVYATLTAADVPCEIVGLGGLLSLPEVADVVATLRLLDDATSNPDLVRLLTGPRWAIGKSDLLALGRRARDLARPGAGPERPDGRDEVLVALEEAVGSVDPSDVVCLLDAVADPGPAPLSAEARRRLRAFDAELSELRRHAEEPVLDLIRRVVDTLGLEVELAATPALARRGVRSQLHTFLDAAAGYVDVDGDASLSGLVSWLQAEDEQGSGLEQAVPSEQDSVKLLTIHRAKGLEWERVYLPALVDKTFPSDRVTDNWVTSAATLPAELRGDAASVPQLMEASDAGFKAYKEALSVQARLSEDRLAYVAVTRARTELVATAHWWRPGVQRPRMPSPYLVTTRGLAHEIVADAPPPAPSEANPLDLVETARTWPPALDEDGRGARSRAAALVAEASGRIAAGGAVDDPAEPVTSLDDAERVAAWDDEADFLLAEATAATTPCQDVVVPASLTATQVMFAVKAPQRFAAELVRPMPRPPSRSATFGTRFHEWVERRFGQQTLPDLDVLLPEDPGPDSPLREADAESEADLVELCQRFADGMFGDRLPAATEHPFSLMLGDHVVRGRIDAAYAEADGTWLVVDWKTGRAETADPLQLALYRLAWAELHQVQPCCVQAGFYWVRSDRLELVEDLPDRDGLERLLRGLTG